jgi:hypothetical protein
MFPFDFSKVQAHSEFVTKSDIHGCEEYNEGGQMEVDSVVALKLHPSGLEVTFGTKNIFNIANLFYTIGVATLTLGSRPKQWLVKVRAKNEAQESHFMLSRMW